MRWKGRHQDAAPANGGYANRDRGRTRASGPGVRSAVCGQCWRSAPEGEELIVDKRNSVAYCAACWKAYYGRSPSRGRCHVDVQEEPREKQVRSSGRSRGSVEEAAGGCAAAPESPRLDDKVLVSSSPADELLDAGPTGSAAPGSSSKPHALRPVDVAAARFNAACDALQERYGAERFDEVDQQQLEEIEALGDIYGDALTMVGDDGERPIKVRLELPVKLDGDGLVDLVVETDDGEAHVGSVRDLPPLVLLCAFPARYPETEPPLLAVQAEHLSAEKASELEGELQRLALDRAGDPMLFELASTLEERPPPRRLVFGGGQDGMDVVLGLLAHDHSVRDERRLRETQPCMVCFDELLGSRGLFLSCGHFGCRDCLGHMAKLHIGEANLSALRCPITDCREGFGLDAMQELSLQHCLDTMRDVAYCPRCDEQAGAARAACIMDEDGCARCDACGFVFCGRCRLVFHPGTVCASSGERLEALEQRAVGPGKEADAARAELMSMRLILTTSRSCPGCSSSIEKTSGCNKMRCRVCQTQFCWKCGKEIEGYDHFASAECKLFGEEEIRRWNQEMRTTAGQRDAARAHEARFLRQFLDPVALKEQGRRCPKCKAVSMREGKNNLMRCPACWNRFCAVCSVLLPRKGAGDHFNKAGCPQHSE
eukprot:TRINITY_DN27435_c0_g1_i2.p1 TRINITY_DN27435_c0_g1~~TRINITY_DN27435_c0_g1_i2.p1  ORF type:complete len:656 (-),score=99.40 TRINITY_DN27435_c0_g1_i2:196-2163(-)